MIKIHFCILIFQESIFDTIKPKHTNIVTAKLRRLEEVCISVHSKYPVLFLLFGSCFILIPIIGLQDFDATRYETDLTRLMSPLESKTLKDKEEIQRLFEDMTFTSFYPHQSVFNGFDLSVLRLLPYFNETALEIEKDFYKFMFENVTVRGDNDSNVAFRDLCAINDGKCVVQGSEIFQEPFTKALIGHNVTYPTFQGSDLSGLKVIKLEFILRLKIKHNDWLIADTCPQAANQCALF